MFSIWVHQVVLWIFVLKAKVTSNSLFFDNPKPKPIYTYLLTKLNLPETDTTQCLQNLPKTSPLHPQIISSVFA